MEEVPSTQADRDVQNRFVSSIQVKQLFDELDISLTFSRHKNFIIGPNGSGKTTIIHILASCLKGDFIPLFELPFKSAKIVLTSVTTSLDTTISVTKELSPSAPGEGIHVIISGPNLDYDEIIASRSAQIEDTIFDTSWAHVQEMRDIRRLTSTTTRLSEIIEKLTTTTWLSIYRSDVRQSGRPLGRMNPIDRHLDSISRRFSQYNSRKNALVSEQNTDFQKKVFLSFLTPRVTLADLRRRGTLDIDERVRQLYEILAALGVPLSESEDNIQRYKDELSRSAKNIQLKRQGRLSFRDEVTLLSVNQTDEVIAHWSEYRDKASIIQEGITELLSVLHEYFVTKTPRLYGDEILFLPPTQRKILRAPQLSSGEKQIYIFLMEALLQREDVSIFIADEPELSLHVAWQERLVPSILRLSPKAQLIFATHSPDIVGPDQDSIIDMEVAVQHA
jgi:predicted ATPase